MPCHLCGVFPDRGDHKRRVQEPVDRAPAPITVKDELIILAVPLARAVRKLQHGGPSR